MFSTAPPSPSGVTMVDVKSIHHFCVYSVLRAFGLV